MFHNLVIRLRPPRRDERILLNLLLPIGDTLFATPTIRALRLRFPAAHIVALVFPTNAGILRQNPDIDAFILHPTGQTFTPIGYVRFLLRVRRRRFTLAAEFRPYSWWFSLLCGIWRRLSFNIPVYQWLLPLGRRPTRNRHAVESYASLLEPLGLKVDRSRLIVGVAETDRASVNGFLAEQLHDDQGDARGPTIIAIHPGGEGFRGMKRWGAKRFAVLADRLAQRHEATIILIGGHDERWLAEHIATLMKSTPIVANGRLSIGETVALLERSLLFVGNDSAPLHIAASLRTPTVGLYGPTSVVNYEPIGPYVEVARSGIVCSPCFYFVSSSPVWDTSHCRVPTCLHALSVEKVLACAARVLARSEESEDAHASIEPLPLTMNGDDVPL